MAEAKKLVLATDDVKQDGGEIVLAPEVIEVVVGIAASNVKGVYGMRGNLATNVTELLGRNAHGKGVYLKATDAGLVVDLYCYLEYGAIVPKVALEMQNQVKQQVLHMTDLELAEVNIHVVGVVSEKIPALNVDEILAEEDE